MFGSLGRAGGCLLRVLRATDVRGAAARRHAGGEAHAEAYYRQFPRLSRRQVLVGEFLSGFTWFWILWHFWHDPDAVLGHFPYPDASKWTDEELGIPPDEEE